MGEPALTHVLDEQDFIDIVDTLSQGLMVLDRNLIIRYWNRWLEQHTRIRREQALGKNILELYPGLEAKGFTWKVDSVFRLGSYAFFSQRLHQYLLPVPTTRYLEAGYELMQQNVVIAPLPRRSPNVERVTVSISDITDSVIYRDKLQETKEALEEASRTDHLTGLANRLHLMERLAEEFSFHQRHRETLGIAIIDVDHFKNVNDTYGHLCGDEVLMQLAELFRNNLRPYDVIGRYGGEEFCVLLPKTPVEHGLAVLQRLKQKVQDHLFVWGPNELHCTISIGLACNNTDDTHDLALHRADEALYQAKNKGRNRVETLIS